MTDPRRAPIVLAAGGTGGHMFPALALAAELERRGHRPVLFTDARGKTYADKQAGLDAVVVPSASPSRGGPLAKAGFFFTLARGSFLASRLLRGYRPRAVVAFGGYAAFPTGYMALRQGVPLVLHEQNAYLGLANRKLAHGARAIALAFPKVEGLRQTAARIVQVGNPVRQPFVALRERLYAPPEAGRPLRLLIMGGSQGARVFSEIVPAAIGLLAPALRARLDISQQCRPEDLASTEAAYAALGLQATLKGFFDDVPERLGAAHLAILRAGASTVAEITVAGRPAIFVPYPHAADDHQRHNAQSVAAAGAGWVIAQPDFTAPALAGRIAALAADPAALAAAAEAARAFGKPNAAAALADLVERMRPRTDEPAA